MDKSTGKKRELIALANFKIYKALNTKLTIVIIMFMAVSGTYNFIKLNNCEIMQKRPAKLNSESYLPSKKCIMANTILRTKAAML